MPLIVWSQAGREADPAQQIALSTTGQIFLAVRVVTLQPVREQIKQRNVSSEGIF